MRSTKLTLKDGDEIRIEREPITVEAMLPFEPDPNWSFIDKAGHEHRWAAGATAMGVPTTKPKKIDEWWCSDCHETHEDWAMVCSICGEEVRAGTRPARATNYIARPATYYLNGEKISEERGRAIVESLGG